MNEAPNDVLTTGSGSGEQAHDYAARRVSYTAGELHETGLAGTPLGQFERWYDDAVRHPLPEPNALVLATVSARGEPSARTVLLKEVDTRGFVFYTNHLSRKGRDILEGPGSVALVFSWYPMQRQVAVRGVAEPVGRDETRGYFGSRPWASRIGAWASRQSETVADRDTLDQAWEDCARRWPDTGRPDDVPVPDHWGGFVVRARDVEFWQGRASRLHDRLAYVADAGPAPLDAVAAWRVERRQP